MASRVMVDAIHLEQARRSDIQSLPCALTCEPTVAAYGKNGNSFRIRASSGRVPYSQISNASACRTALPFCRTVPLHERGADGWRSAVRRASREAISCAPPRPSAPSPACRRPTAAIRRPATRARPACRSFLSITSSIATATSGRNGFGRWNPSSKYMNTGFLRRARRIGRDVRHDHHVGGVLDEDAGVAMIGVIVVRPRREHEVGVPLRESAGSSARERRASAAVRRRGYRGRHTRCRCGAPASCASRAPPRRERTPAFGLVAGIAIGDRDEAHAVAERSVLRRRAAGADIAVVGWAPNAMILSLPSALGAWVRCGACCPNGAAASRAGPETGSALHKTTMQVASLVIITLVITVLPPLSEPDAGTQTATAATATTTPGSTRRRAPACRGRARRGTSRT